MSKNKLARMDVEVAVCLQCRTLQPLTPVTVSHHKKGTCPHTHSCTVCTFSGTLVIDDKLIRRLVVLYR